MSNIEILENYLKFIKKFDNNYALIPALENLIQEYKELKNKCNELNFKYTAQWVDDNFIPKSKVKEKIEELRKKQIKNTTEKLFYDYDINRVIIMLKELLEEGE